MNELKITAGGSSGQVSLAMAVFTTALGVHLLLEAIDRGSILGSIVAASQLPLAGHFALHWYRYWTGNWKMVYNADGFEIRERGTLTATGRFSQLSGIDQDGRGYTITLRNGSLYRLLRSNMDEALQVTLDAAQKEAEQTVRGNRHRAHG